MWISVVPHSHAKYIQVLKQVLLLLAPGSAEVDISASAQSENTFSVLEVDHNNYSSSEDIQGRSSDRDTAEQKPCTREFVLEDDDNSDASFAIYSLFVTAHRVRICTEDNWRKAVNGDIDILSTVILTNAVLGLLESEEKRVVQQLPETCSVLSTYWSLAHTFFTGFLRKKTFTPGDQAGYNNFSPEFSLMPFARCILDLANLTKLSTTPRIPTEYAEDPDDWDYFLEYLSRLSGAQSFNNKINLEIDKYVGVSLFGKLPKPRCRLDELSNLLSKALKGEITLTSVVAARLSMNIIKILKCSSAASLLNSVKKFITETVSIEATEHEEYVTNVIQFQSLIFTEARPWHHLPREETDTARKAISIAKYIAFYWTPSRIAELQPKWGNAPASAETAISENGLTQSTISMYFLETCQTTYDRTKRI